MSNSEYVVLCYYVVMIDECATCHLSGHVSAIGAVAHGGAGRGAANGASGQEGGGVQVFGGLGHPAVQTLLGRQPLV
jgi:hypothetical protein